MLNRPVVREERKPRFQQIRHQQSGNSQWSWLLLLGLLLCIPITFGMSGLQSKASSEPSQSDQSVTGSEPETEFLRVPLAIPSAVQVASAGIERLAPVSAKQHGWHTVTVQQGDTLTSIFSQLNLHLQQVHSILSQGGPARLLDKLHPGDILRMRIEPKGTLQELVYPLSATDAIRVRRSGQGFGVTSIHRIPEKRIVHAVGTIDASLFLAARKAGLSHQITMELARLFGWDIDFALDVRRGDQFTVLYEELYLDGEKIGDGDIVAAEFINRRITFLTVRFTSPTGENSYYTPDGNSMRKTFLRTPLKFSRITSRFNLRRKHPVLNTIRAHKGVDYAAPTGTPVMAAGAGVVYFKGRKGGYGRAIIVKHGNRYKTLYGHLSRYAKGIYNGKRVQQGQTIGYVGSSGMATGPHLHYEFLVDGVHRNPLTAPLPAAQPIPARYREDFKQQAEQLLARLRLVKSTTVAQLNPSAAQ